MLSLCNPWRHMGSEGMAPFTLNLGNRYSGWPASGPGRCTPEKRVPSTYSVGLDGPKSRSKRFREDKNLLPLPGIEPRCCGRWARSLIPIPTIQSHWNSLTFANKRCPSVPCIFTSSWHILQMYYTAAKVTRVITGINEALYFAQGDGLDYVQYRRAQECT